jgi:hypothetical protein
MLGEPIDPVLKDRIETLAMFAAHSPSEGDRAAQRHMVLALKNLIISVVQRPGGYMNMRSLIAGFRDFGRIGPADLIERLLWDL